jgi:hypothetical protein
MIDGIIAFICGILMFLSLIGGGIIYIINGPTPLMERLFIVAGCLAFGICICAMPALTTQDSPGDDDETESEESK